MIASWTALTPSRSITPRWYRAIRSGAATIVISSTASRPPKPVRSAELPTYSSGVTRVGFGEVPPVSTAFVPEAGATSPFAVSSRRTSLEVLVAVKTLLRPLLRVTLS